MLRSGPSVRMTAPRLTHLALAVTLLGCGGDEEARPAEAPDSVDTAARRAGSDTASAAAGSDTASAGAASDTASAAAASDTASAGAAAAEARACPRGWSPDPARAARLRAALTETEAVPLLEEEARWCFGPSGPSVVGDGLLYLDARQGDAALAARAAHLLAHVRDGLGEPPPGRPCEEWVHEALGAEARAYALELRLREALGAGPAPWAFAEASEGGARAEPIRAWLEAHPEGGAGVGPLARDYRSRCER